jgi:cell division septation protein DedD
MKRFFLVILCGLLFNILCMAQSSLANFTQRGVATQEMKADGLSIAHPSLPIGSKVQVTNVVTGKKIDVTVTGRIPASSARIVDLSPGAASALELEPNGTVLISVPPATRPRPAVAIAPPEPAKEEPAPEPAKEEPAPAPAPEPVADVPEEKPPEPVKEEPPPEPPKEEPAPAPAPAPEPAPVQDQRPLNITVYNYLTKPEEPQTLQPESVSSTPIPKSGADTDFLAWLYSMDARSSRDAMDARDARDVRDGRDARDVRDARDARDADIRDARDVRDVRDARDVRDVRDARDVRDVARAQPQTQPVSPAPQPQIIQIIPNTGAPASPSSQTMYIQGSPAPAAPAPATPAQPVQPAQTYQPQIYTPPPVVQVNPTPSPVPSGELRIKPGLPDRNSKKVYRLQVGAFASIETANQIYQTLRSNGFNAIQEQAGNLYRVLVTGIPAADVYTAAVRLGSLGFREILVKE